MNLILLVFKYCFELEFGRKFINEKLILCFTCVFIKFCLKMCILLYPCVFYQILLENMHKGTALRTSPIFVPKMYTRQCT